MADKSNRKMQVLQEELMSLRDQAIHLVLPQKPPKRRFFSGNKQNNRDCTSAIQALLTIRQYFVGNIFNKDSEQKQMMIAALVNSQCRKKLIEVFFLVTAKATLEQKNKLIDLQKILGLRSEVLSFKMKGQQSI